MRYAASNIAWTVQDDPLLYEALAEYGFEGLEIAPTRLFPDKPYEQLGEAARFADELKARYGLRVVSMQSILFGRDEALFGTDQERDNLLGYLREAVEFAAVLSCRNLVFGSPKNRVIGSSDPEVAVRFFREVGNYAASRGVVVALEPNPAIYGTDFLNTTAQAADFVRRVGSPGIGLNFDFGTFLHNGEDLSEWEALAPLVHHVHISEPYLEKIAPRPQHAELARQLNGSDFSGYVSIEMKRQPSADEVKEVMRYIKNTFDVA